MTEKKLISFLELAITTANIMESTADWETKYEILLGDDDCVAIQVRSLGIDLDYCDPDSSYQEDCLAFHAAVRDKAEELAKAFGLTK
ncbi:TPA: hypothetical protein DF272_06445 [Candidatus Falkowbacteria bacterium]|nr:hypothetical protein [Candidatus Falkowbacteria bacterium]